MRNDCLGGRGVVHSSPICFFANGDGVIDANDPVFSQLLIWQDKNQNGSLDANANNPTTHELTSLAGAGITSLDYTHYRYTQHGSIKLLASPDLEAESIGTRTAPSPNGIRIETNNGLISLVVGKVNNLDPAVPGSDVFTVGEDERFDVTVLGGDLLANDRLGNLALPTGTVITRVFNARNLTALSLDANGNVHLAISSTAGGNNAAGFDYEFRAPGGQTATATVGVNVTQDNTAPTVTFVYDSRNIDYYGIDAQTGFYITSPYTDPVDSTERTTVIGPLMQRSRVSTSGLSTQKCNAVKKQYGCGSSRHACRRSGRMETLSDRACGSRYPQIE